MKTPTTIQSTFRTEVWFRWALVFFFIASLFGLLMRYFFVGGVEGLSYKNIMHAHSHVAMMGWAFMAMSLLLLYMFNPAKNQKVYHTIFLINTVVTLGMSLSFLLSGYSLLSIALSTIHVFCTYAFGFYFLRDVKAKSAATTFARWAVIWLLISSIGLWAVAPVGQILGKLHPLYFMSVQFFLHFQFNGWFVYGVLALIIQLTGGNIIFKKHTILFLHLSLLLTYALSVSWGNPASVLFYLNTTGVLLQLVAFGLVLIPLRKALLHSFQLLQTLPVWLMKAGIACLAIKVLVQTAVALPFVAVISYTIRLYVIGFIHLIMLGAITLTMVGLAMFKKILPVNKVSFLGWMLVFSGFVLTELILFTQGTMLWAEQGYLPNYHQIIYHFSYLFPVGIALAVFGSFIHGNSQISNSQFINIKTKTR